MWEGTYEFPEEGLQTAPVLSHHAPVFNEIPHVTPVGATSALLVRRSREHKLGQPGDCAPRGAGNVFRFVHGELQVGEQIFVSQVNRGQWKSLLLVEVNFRL